MVKQAVALWRAGDHKRNSILVTDPPSGLQPALEPKTDVPCAPRSTSRATNIFIFHNAHGGATPICGEASGAFHSGASEASGAFRSGASEASGAFRGGASEASGATPLRETQAMTSPWRSGRYWRISHLVSDGSRCDIHLPTHKTRRPAEAAAGEAAAGSGQWAVGNTTTTHTDIHMSTHSDTYHDMPPWHV